MKIIVANWKMNHGFDEIDQWIDTFYKIYSRNFSEFQKYLLILCPPVVFLDYLDSEMIEDGFKFLELVAEKEHRDVNQFSVEEINDYVLQGRPLKLGAQDCHFEESGSYTGDISAKMLKDLGCEYVILGHSERRSNYLETNETVIRKAKTALENNLIPIICVGENIETRNSKQHFDFVKKQLIESVPNNIRLKKLIIAYEPIWAIGTGESATYGQITEMSEFIKNIFDQELAGIAEEYYLLYGGSVNTQNSSEILSIDKIDGLLVGKSSLDAETFLSLCPVDESKETDLEDFSDQNSQENSENKSKINWKIKDNKNETHH